MARPAQRGFTLLELMAAVAVSAVLMGLAVPTYADFAARHRLAAAADALVLDLQWARFEAVRRQQPVHASFRAGPAWCWAVSIEPGCDCAAPGAQSCALRHAEAADFAGVRLTQSAGVAFDPRHGGAAAGIAAELAGGRDFGMRVAVNAAGRARACAAAAPMPGLPGC